MDNRSVAGATTVVGAMSDIGPGEYDKPWPNGKGKSSFSAPLAAKFGPQPNYLDATRPFFVPIGKDGVIGALQKLDGQLRQVCLLLVSSEVRVSVVLLRLDKVVFYRVKSLQTGSATKFDPVNLA